MITYNKLVRDRIPGIIAAEGKRCELRYLSPAEHLAKLNEKLGEELQEYLASGDVSELADLVEVVHGILDRKGMLLAEFEALRQRKRGERGGFDQGILLISVTEPSEQGDPVSER